MIFSKISIAIFLIRIIVEKVHLMLIYVALFINVLSGLAFFLVTMLQCHPVSYFWNKNQDGYCISVDIIIALTYVYSVFNIICDFTFALLPIVIVKGLNMNRKLKIAIIPLLSMGCVASSAVVVRLAYVQTFRDPEYLCKFSHGPSPAPLLMFYLCYFVIFIPLLFQFQFNICSAPSHPTSHPPLKSHHANHPIPTQMQQRT